MHRSMMLAGELGAIARAIREARAMLAEAEADDDDDDDDGATPGPDSRRLEG